MSGDTYYGCILCVFCAHVGVSGWGTWGIRVGYTGYTGVSSVGIRIPTYSVRIPSYPVHCIPYVFHAYYDVSGCLLSGYVSQRISFVSCVSSRNNIVFHMSCGWKVWNTFVSECIPAYPERIYGHHLDITRRRSGYIRIQSGYIRIRIKGTPPQI